MEINDLGLPRILQLPRIHDPRGNLTFAQGGAQLPFELKRAYWVYDVPAGEERGGHSHHELTELVVAVSGSFSVNLFDGFSWKSYMLNKPFEGLLIPSGFWRTLDDFSSGAVCVVLTSDYFKEADYVRDLDEFRALALERGPLF